MTRIKRIPCGMVNCYLLTGKDGAVLVDTGETGYEEKILEACAGKNVRLIMLTHGHIDHIQNAAYLARELKAPIGMNEKDLALKQAAFKVDADREKAKADIAYTIEEQRERKNFEAERAAAELLRLQKQTELERQQVEIQREKLNVDIREKAEAERDKRIFEAEAEKAERQAKADAELYEAEKLAAAIRLKGEAEAIAIERKADAMQRYGQAAMLEMLINQLPDIARAIGEPLAQTEKIILFGEGATTGLTRDMTGSMMQVFEAMKAATGMDIPKMLQTVSKGGLVGRQIEEAAGRETAE